MKRVSLLFCILFCCFLLFLLFSFSLHIYSFDGILTNGETEEAATAVCRFRNIDTLLLNKLHGKIKLTLENGESISLSCDSTVFKLGPCCFVYGMRYSAVKNKMVPLQVIFDQKIENLVIISDDFQFIAATADFCLQTADFMN